MQQTFQSSLSTHLTPAPGNFWRGFVLGCRNALRPASAGQLVQAGCSYAGGLGDLRTGVVFASPTTPTAALWPAGCCGRCYVSQQGLLTSAGQWPVELGAWTLWSCVVQLREIQGGNVGQQGLHVNPQQLSFSTL